MAKVVKNYARIVSVSRSFVNRTKTLWLWAVKCHDCGYGKSYGMEEHGEASWHGTHHYCTILRMGQRATDLARAGRSDGA